MYCMELLRYEDKEIQQMGEARLIGIATRLYYEETPVILTMGMDSYLEAEKRNQNSMTTIISFISVMANV